MATVSERPDYGAFIPSYLDDYPLKPCEFRVYARILRRAGTKGGHHWEGMPATAKACGMNVKTVRAAVRLLQAANMIVLHEIPGRPNDIQPTHHDQWVNSSQVETLRKTLTPTKTTPTESGRGTRSGTPESGRTPLPREVDAPTELGRTPLPREVDEGNPLKVPLEGDPLKVDPPSPQGGNAIASQGFQLEEQHLEQSRNKPPFLALVQQQRTPEKRQGTSRAKSSARRRKPKNADAIYGMLGDRDGFEAFWQWYRQKVCPIRSQGRDGRTAEEGSKAEAAWAWVRLEECDFLGHGRDGFKDGCRLQIDKYKATGGLGIPNACRYLYPGSGSPPWAERLQERITPVVTEEFMPVVARSRVEVEVDEMPDPDSYSQALAARLNRQLGV